MLHNQKRTLISRLFSATTMHHLPRFHHSIEGFWRSMTPVPATCFTAMAEISISALPIKPATCPGTAPVYRRTSPIAHRLPLESVLRNQRVSIKATDFRPGTVPFRRHSLPPCRLLRAGNGCAHRDWHSRRYQRRGATRRRSARAIPAKTRASAPVARNVVRRFDRAD